MTPIRWPRLPILLLAALATRVAVLGNPVVQVDEEFYFTVARAMGSGAVPFVDVWDRKPIGLFLLYWPAAALPLPWGTLVYQVIALACATATAWLAARLADAAGWGRGATMAGIAYLLWLVPLGGVSGQSPVFYNLLTAGAAALIVLGRPGSRRRGLGAMALIGWALQIKYSVVFEGVAFGLWLLAAEWRRSARVMASVGYGAALIAAALAPTLLAWGVYAASGHGEAFVFANFTSVLARRPDPLAEQLRNAGILILILSPLVAMAFGGRAGTGNRAAQFVQLWLAVAIAGVAVFGGWFDHYGLPIVLPAACAAAGFLGEPQHRRLAAVALAGAAVAGQATVAVNRANRGDAAQFAALVQAVGRRPGCLHVYSGTPLLYAATGRCRVSRYLFPSHLNRAREQGAIGVDQAAELRRILDARPAVIVMRRPFHGELPAMRALVERRVARDYRPAATLPMGSDRLTVFRLATTPS